MNYLDNIMQNDFVDKYSSEPNTEFMQFGGSDNKATGGFPPIYKCNKDGSKINNEKKDRGFSTKVSAVSIKEIMQNRRDETPFSL